MLVVVIQIILILLTACQVQEKTVCPLENLLLDKTVFPNGATEDSIGTPIKDKPIRSAARTLYYNNTVVFQYVIEYSTSDRAQKIYQDELNATFPQNKYVGSWKAPDFGFKSKTSEAYQYLCGEMDNRNVCRYFARYSTYIVYLQVYISTTGLSETDFQRAMNFIDLKMVSCILGDQQVR